MTEKKEGSDSDFHRNSVQDKSSDSFSVNLNIDKKTSKWVDNYGKEVDNVFGFNENAELVNGRVAMVGFMLLIITELAFSGSPVTHSIFGIG